MSDSLKKIMTSLKLLHSASVTDTNMAADLDEALAVLSDLLSSLSELVAWPWAF